ncbi:hypothetical protein EVAR_14724_1 [Eumeta japonica]|uniref:Uncharacterized protein n=1 Tax=Eumeta variegata TaxID=151549 RepID=A0A4C1TWD0_EUMVA|nr:hypothetical protein EVAR_14724_1 [Eumeta japonica]
MQCMPCQKTVKYNAQNSAALNWLRSTHLLRKCSAPQPFFLLPCSYISFTGSGRMTLKVQRCVAITMDDSLRDCLGIGSHWHRYGPGPFTLLGMGAARKRG